MPSRKPQVRYPRRPYDRRAVGCHRPQPGPELRLAYVAGLREQVADDELERTPPALVQVEIESRQLGSPTDADALAEPRNGDLVRLVHDRRLRCFREVADRDRDRETLDRVNRD